MHCLYRESSGYLMWGYERKLNIVRVLPAVDSDQFAQAGTSGSTEAELCTAVEGKHLI